MTGNDLLLWRRERKLKQVDLATLLGVSRKTLVNWETGKHRLPLNIVSRLEHIAITVAPRKKSPDVISIDNMHHWPHLKLYYKSPYKAEGMVADSEHPKQLFPQRWPLGVPHAPIPAAFLESPEYLEALERRRADPTPYHSDRDWGRPRITY